VALVRSVNGALRQVPVGLVYVMGGVPFAWLIWALMTHGLGVDPTKTLEHQLGGLGLKFLLASLAVTPLRRITGVSLMRFRRALGLLAFFYVVLHLMTWLLLDLQLRWGEIGADVTKRPYIILGMLGFALMVPLAATSHDSAVRRMGALAWHRLHRLVYLASLAVVGHYVVQAKTLSPEVLACSGCLIALLVARVAWALAKPSAPRS
jgi:methionine sulfoxide reductase heme-binding subunit